MKRKTYGTLALAFVLVLGIGLVMAHQGNGANYNEERHDAMEAAMDAGDYNAWKELHEEYGHGKIMDVVTEENFDRFVEMHEAMEDGDYETASEIRSELGLGQGRGKGLGQGKSMGEFRSQGRMQGHGQGHGNCMEA